MGLFSSQYRQSYRQIKNIMAAVFSIESAQIGESLLAQEKKLFNLWHQFRNEQLTRSELVQAIEPIQAEISSILQEAAELEIGENEKTPLAKTVRTCRNLLKLEAALWLFIRAEDVLNAQERNILDFLAESVSAARSGGVPPSLLP